MNVIFFYRWPIIINWGHQLLLEAGPGGTCYQLTQPLLAIPALMHSQVECTLPSPFHTHVLKEPFTQLQEWKFCNFFCVYVLFSSEKVLRSGLSLLKISFFSFSTHSCLSETLTLVFHRFRFQCNKIGLKYKFKVQRKVKRTHLTLSTCIACSASFK